MINEKLHRIMLSRSFHAFAFGVSDGAGGVVKYLKTKDEHDAETPIKPFPEAAYLRVIADLLVVSGGLMEPSAAIYALEWGIPLDHLTHLYETRKLAIEKSRQLKITWVVLAYLLWRAKFFEHQLIMVQSKRSVDAYALVSERRDDATSRLAVMETHLPPFLQSLDMRKHAVKGILNFPNGTKIEAIAEGGSKIRSRTPTLLFSDEAAFQPEFGEAYKAALPAVSGGGQAIFVSSAEVSEFQRVVGSLDDIDDDYDAMLSNPSRFELVDGGMKRGLTTRINSDSNLFVCRLYHTADPEKCPATPAGKDWLYQEERGYPGGIGGPGWQKEMGIRYTVGGGGKVFPRFGAWRKESQIFIRPVQNVVIGSQAQVWASYDHGFVNPACYLVHLVYPRENEVWFQTVWEFYASGLLVPEIAAIINGKPIRTSDGREFPGNPFAGREKIKICDPEIERRRPSANEVTSIHQMFRDEGVMFVKGESGGDSMIADYLNGTLWRDPMRPRYQIGENCEHLIWELGRLQLKKHKSALMSLSKNDPEDIVDRDNHAFDALKYFLKRLPRGYNESAPVEREGTFSWWMDLANDPLHRRVMPTYRRK